MLGYFIRDFFSSFFEAEYWAPEDEADTGGAEPAFGVRRILELQERARREREARRRIAMIVGLAAVIKANRDQAGGVVAGRS